MKTGAELDRLELEVLQGAREQLAPTRAERGALRAVVLSDRFDQVWPSLLPL